MAALENLITAIRVNHGASARHVTANYVREEFRGETVWDGDVQVFELADHPDVDRCYAWEYETDDGKRLVATVLGVPPITSALTAVHAYIASGQDSGPTMD